MVARASHSFVKSPFSLLLLAAATLPSAATKIVALSAVAPKIDANNLPGEIQVLKWGDNQTTQGIVRVGKKTLACLAANQASTGFEEVCLDFAHNTVEGSPTYKGEPVQVAATHCKPEVREGEGLFLMSVNWTDEGKEFAAHYPDVSGAVGLDESGEVIFIHSAGICRQGCARDIKLFSASLPVLDGPQEAGQGRDPYAPDDGRQLRRPGRAAHAAASVRRRHAAGHQRRRGRRHRHHPGPGRSGRHDAGRQKAEGAQRADADNLVRVRGRPAANDSPRRPARRAARFPRSGCRMPTVKAGCRSPSSVPWRPLCRSRCRSPLAPRTRSTASRRG